MTTPSAGTPTSLTSTITTPAATSTPKSTNPQTAPSTIAGGPVDRDQIYQWILELSSPETRETALLELSKKREVVPDLAPMLWNSFGTIAALLQEIIAIYPAINPPALTAHQSNRVCNALALLQVEKKPFALKGPTLNFNFFTVRGLTPRDAVCIPSRSYSALLVPIPPYSEQNSPF